MAMSVLNEMGDSGSDVYYTKAWRLLVESHLTWLRSSTEMEVVAITPQLGYKYEGDFFGALTELNIPRYMHWTVMRVNGLYSSTAYNGEAVTVMIPARSTLQQLVAVSLTGQKKIT